MSAEPVDSHTSRLVREGEFEPDGIGDDEASAFTKNMYEIGVGLMRTTLADS